MELPAELPVIEERIVPLIAPAPRRIIENSIASSGLLVEIVRSKYIEPLPLYRQEQSLERRFGMLIHRKLMSGSSNRSPHSIKSRPSSENILH